MDALNFCYWLQGYFELRREGELTDDQVQIINDHLQLVFSKQTPIRNNLNSVQGTQIQSPIYPICSIDPSKLPMGCGIKLPEYYKVDMSSISYNGLNCASC